MEAMRKLNKINIVVSYESEYDYDLLSIRMIKCGKNERINMDLEKIVICTFQGIINKYDMQSAIISENEVVLFTDKYILSFLYHSGELEMVYIEKKENGELYQYNIDSFIAYSISEEDRIQIKERLQKETKIVIELELLSCTLEKKWEDLLLGGKEWVKEFQNFLLYVPVRNVTKIKEEKYRRKCGLETEE